MEEGKHGEVSCRSFLINSEAAANRSAEGRKCTERKAPIKLKQVVSRLKKAQIQYLSKQWKHRLKGDAQSNTNVVSKQGKEALPSYWIHTVLTD